MYSLECCETFQTQASDGGPPKHKQSQTEEFSSQHVIFMLLWTTAADLRSNLFGAPISVPIGEN